MQFIDVTDANEHDVNTIFAGETAQYWVHYNDYWLKNSRKHTDISAKLILVDEQESPIGFVAYGQHYEDEALTKKKSGWYEVIHLVIDEKHQGKGYGREATVKAIELLKKQDDCEAIVIAHHPDNQVAHTLYQSLGFVEVGKNYDDDPLLKLDIVTE